MLTILPHFIPIECTSYIKVFETYLTHNPELVQRYKINANLVL